MTNTRDNEEKNISTARKAIKAVLPTIKMPIAIMLLASTIIHFSDKAALGAYNGMMTCINTFIPSVFPFMVLSEAVVYLIGNKTGALGYLFERVFGIRSLGSVSYVNGILCGYPVGISGVVSLRKTALISKEEADILMPLCASPSLAFVTVGVGLSMYGEIKYGVLMYLTVVVAGAITGIIFKRKSTFTHFTEENARQTFDFSSIIINSLKRTAYACAFVVFFTSITEIGRTAISSPIIYSILSGICEVSSGAIEICRLSDNIGTIPSFIICSAILSFGGISVLLQAKALKGDSDISVLSFLKFKLVHALISAVLAYTASHLSSLLI